VKLSQKLSGAFTRKTRERGQRYYWQDAVRFQTGTANRIIAFVQGSKRYELTLDLEDDVLSVFCECPYFVSDGPCKHLWATILAAEAKAYLSAADKLKTITLDYGAVDDVEDFGDPDHDDSDYGAPRYPPRPMSVPRPPTVPAWQRVVAEISTPPPRTNWDPAPWPAKRQVLYIVDVPACVASGNLVVSLASRDRKADGSFTRTAPLTPRRYHIDKLPLAEDREILAMLAGGTRHYSWSYVNPNEQMPESYVLPVVLQEKIVRQAVQTGRCHLRVSPKEDDVPLAWDSGDPWQFRLQIGRGARKGWAVTGILRRGDEQMDLASPALVTSGFVFTRGRVAPLAPDTSFAWISQLRKTRSIEAPDQDKDNLLAALLSAPGLPPLDVPEELRYEEVAPPPRPCLKVHAADASWRGSERLPADLYFDYDGWMAPELYTGGGFYDAETHRFLRRDAPAEAAAAAFLTEAGVKLQPVYYGEASRGLAPSKLPRVVRTLLQAGWHIEAEGKVFRRPGAFRMEVSSGVDWFELHGEVQYGDTTARLPELLEAVRRGETLVRLGDGTYGTLPEEWLERIGTLAGMGSPEDGHIRFRPSQAGLLDALLATQPETTCDATFARVREELRTFHGVTAAEQPAGFQGLLRDYQREGVGWMEFLRRFSFGGCLADDMGVGKTAQVLAVLETRRALRESGEPVAPSLVVVPKSLVFNWKQEAERFTPKLRVLDYTGTARSTAAVADHDVILTTYGTLRRDAARLKDVEFDYLVLDEAQAIKNAGTESAKAVRLLRGAHRLALSGTPVENHLGELWSLFEFLNPGMLGAASVFKLVGGAARNPSEETRQLLAHALRPFLLRRTKAQVARELPEKTEQTVYCEMEPAQRKLYNELRQHYRNSLLHRIETDGLAKSKMHVLEALLRLRQAACHPGLLDPKRKGEGSAKLDVLLDQLREVLDEGHKALVFSQFTSLLAIVRERLDKQGIVYEYLDGSTRDRQARVERFQNDPACPLFLISLKAGGLGLNLTAAEYVFLLDPWWNPAVEAQAVDRAHRIGQTRQVFAYRLIARDTVEEKVLELQQTKRNLADAILGAENSIMRNLKREDLELLLS
jgi:hypothetical protein